jgi:hypothetical protein
MSLRNKTKRGVPKHLREHAPLNMEWKQLHRHLTGVQACNPYRLVGDLLQDPANLSHLQQLSGQNSTLDHAVTQATSGSSSSPASPTEGSPSPM